MATSVTRARQTPTVMSMVSECRLGDDMVVKIEVIGLNWAPVDNYWRIDTMAAWETLKQ